MGPNYELRERFEENHEVPDVMFREVVIFVSMDPSVP